MTNHVVISGYYGYKNAGDEAILSAIIHSLRKVDPDTYITVLSGDPEYTSRLHGVDAIPRTDLFQIMKTLRQSNLLISGGGSLLQDKTGPKSVPYYLGILHLAKWTKTPFMIYAQGIGPVQRKMYQQWISRLLKKAHYVSVRDSLSRNMLINWGLAEQRITEVVDPVLLLPSSGEENGRKILAKEQVSLSKKPILVSMRYWQDNKADFKAVAKCCDELIEAGEEILFLPMHYPEDAQASCEIMSYMKHKAHIIQKEYAPTDLIDVISLGKCMLGMRLHALIFAAARSIPCVAIDYDPKIEAFMGQLDLLPAAKAGSISAHTLLQKVQAVITNETEQAERMEKRVQRLCDLALKPAIKAVEICTANSKHTN